MIRLLDVIEIARPEDGHLESEQFFVCGSGRILVYWKRTVGNGADLLTLWEFLVLSSA